MSFNKKNLNLLFSKIKLISLKRYTFFTIPFNKQNFLIIHYLYINGYISGYFCNLLLHQNIYEKKILIYLKFFYSKGILDNIKLISNRKKIKYINIKNMKKNFIKGNFYLISTNKGLSNITLCLLTNLGGKLLCQLN